MLSKEERTALKEQSYTLNHNLAIELCRKIPALLDELEEAERSHFSEKLDLLSQMELLRFRAKNAESDRAVADDDHLRLQRCVDNLQTDIAEAEVDRDKWKARAQALEQAIHRQPTCYTCKSFFAKSEDMPCEECEHEEAWQFDESRFAGGDVQEV